MSEDESRLTLNVSAERISAVRFSQAYEAFHGQLQEVSGQVLGNRKAITWFVSVDRGSAIVHFTGVARDGNRTNTQRAVRALREGMLILETRPGVWPDHYTEAALVHHRRLASVTQTRIEPLESVAVYFPGAAPHRVTHRTGANIDALLSTEYTAYGSLEGRLDVVSRRGGHLKFCIDDELATRPVNCSFDEDLFDDILLAFRQDRRVSAFGEISYRADGVPNRIRVEELRILKKADDLPTFQDVLGIMKS